MFEISLLDLFKLLDTKVNLGLILLGLILVKVVWFFVRRILIGVLGLFKGFANAYVLAAILGVGGSLSCVHGLKEMKAGWPQKTVAAVADNGTEAAVPSQIDAAAYLADHHGWPFVTYGLFCATASLSILLWKHR